MGRKQRYADDGPCEVPGFGPELDAGLSAVLSGGAGGWDRPDRASLMPDARSLDHHEITDLQALCTSTVGFTNLFWPVVEPAREFVTGWHIDCIGEHLDTVSNLTTNQLPNLIINVPPRCMKLCADDTPVYTPDGWRTHGDLKVGDRVFSPDGRPTTVVAVSPKGPADMVVRLSNGESVEVNGDHLWTVYSRSCRKWRTYTTDHLRRLALSSGGRCTFQLPAVSPLQFPERDDLPFHPYFLGVWLGDGTATKPVITHDRDDSEHLTAIEERCGLRVTITHRHPDPDSRTVQSEFRHQGVIEGIRAAGLFGDKHIPRAYLASSVDQRLQLLAGLIDTDGWTDPSGRVQIATSSARLRDDVVELCLGLGLRPYVTEMDTPAYPPYEGGAPHWRVGFQPTGPIPCAVARKRPTRFALQRAIGIVSVEAVAEPKQGNCITVDREDGLYLVGRTAVPTHNSLLVCVFWFCKTWTQYPGSRWMYGSFSNQLIERDSDRCRDIIKHPLYKRLWNGVRIKDTQDTRLRFTNTAQGFRQCVTTKGSGGMGEGADFLVIDDPQNPKLAASPTERENTIRWYRSTFSRRGNDERTVRKVLIMQRLNERDLTGYLMAEQTGWHQLVLPMRYEPQRYWMPDPQPVAEEVQEEAPAEPVEAPEEDVAEDLPDLPPATGEATPEAMEALKQWADEMVARAAVASRGVPGAAAGVAADLKRPRDAIVLTPLQVANPFLRDGPEGSGRANEGDLLWEERFPLDVVDRAEEELGPDAPGQYGQRPTGEAGDIFQKEYVRRYEPVWRTEPSDLGIPYTKFVGVKLHGPEPGQVREFPAESLVWFQTVDTALSERNRSAYTAAVTFGATPEHDLIVWHAFRGRLNVQYQLPMLMALRHGPAEWWPKSHTISPKGRWPFTLSVQAVERKASGIGIIQEAASKGVVLHPLEADGDKIKRAVPVAGLYRAGKVYHPSGTPRWLTEMEDELWSFPNGAYKDTTDCVAYGGLLLTRDKILRSLIGGPMAHVLPDPDEPPETDARSTIHVRGVPVEVEWPDEAGPFRSIFDRYLGTDNDE